MMECSVRFVYETNNEGKQIAGLKPALCVRGKKHALGVINDDLWVRTIEISLQDHDKAKPVLFHGEPYDPRAFADRFLMAAKAAGKPITRRAKYLLMLREQADEDSLPEELLEREPIQQETIYADNTPKERQKAAQKASPVKDVTEEYRGKTFAPLWSGDPPGSTVTETPESDYERMADIIKRTPGAAVQPATPTTEAKKPIKKPSRPDLRPVVKKAHEAARKAIAPPVKAKPKANGAAKPAAERGTLIKRLAAELKMDPFELRVLIRSTGMRAPYDDEQKVRAAIKQAKKALISIGVSKKRKDNPPLRRAK